MSAERLAETVVERAARRVRRAVEGAQQLDDHLERVGTRRKGGPSAMSGYKLLARASHAGWSDRRSVCSDVSETSRV